MFGHFKYANNQKKIVKECVSENNDEYQKWFFHNLWYPIGIILLSLILIWVTQNLEAVTTQLFNGSISLLGINVLFAMSSYLLRVKVYKQDGLRNDVVNLSAKLSDWKTLLIVAGTILYVVPALYIPENQISKFILFGIAVIILVFSISVSVRIFMIRDDFYKKTYGLEENTYDKDMRNESNEHGQGW